MAKIRCFNCTYFFVTHDKKRPWGCKKFNFKSRSLPSQSVLMTTGTDCAYHSLKASAAQTKRF